MARYVTSIATPMSPDSAFAFMADLTNFPKWDKTVIHAERVSGDGQSVGSSYALKVKTVGTVDMRYEVTEYDAPKRMVIVAKTPFLTSIDEVRVVATPTGSVVTYDAILQLVRGKRLFDGLLGLAFNRLGDRASAGLCAALKGSKV